MLVLTRKYQEKIRIGNNITITVLRTKGKAVRLGIEAPTDVPVVRGELAFEHGSETRAATVPMHGLETVEPSRQRVRASGAMAVGWTTGSGSDAAATREADPKVGLSRVPRNKVADLLPKLVSGTAPLRAMVQQRNDR